MATIEFPAIEFEYAGEALQQSEGHTDGSGQGRAILCDGKHLVVEEPECDRIEAAGVEFAYLVDHEMPDGTFRIMTIPVND